MAATARTAKARAKRTGAKASARKPAPKQVAGRAKAKKPARAASSTSAVASPERPATDPALAGEMLARVRAFCASLPGVTEKLSHGAPTFFLKQGTFANFCDNHHGDGKIAVWCAAPEGAQAMLVESEPEHYFVPAYVGHMGWVGMRVDRGIAWSQVEATLEAAHAARIAKKRR